MITLDHVMYVVHDLDAAARRIRFEYGLDSYGGGEHAGLGTHNRIIPLGPGQYVELIAVADEAAARQTPAGSRILEWAREGEGPRAWCLATDDIASVATRLSMQPLPLTRVLPGGEVLRWRLLAIDRAMADPSLPFFIEWENPAEHPSGVDVDHTADILGVSWIEVGGDAEKISRWTESPDLPVRVVDADEGVRALGIATADGEIVLR